MLARTLILTALLVSATLLPERAIAQTPTGNFGFAISGASRPIHQLQVGAPPRVDREEEGLNCKPVFSTNRIRIGEGDAQVVPAGSRGEYRIKCKFKVTDSDGDTTRIRVKGVASLITRKDPTLNDQVRPFLKILLEGKKKLDLDGDLTKAKIEVRGRSFFNVFSAFVQLKPRLEICLLGSCAGDSIKFALDLAPESGDWSVSNGSLVETAPGILGGSATVRVGGQDLPFDVEGVWNGSMGDYVELVSTDVVVGGPRRAAACDDDERPDGEYPVHWIRLKQAKSDPRGLRGSLEVCLVGQRYTIDPFVLDLTP